MNTLIVGSGKGSWTMRGQQLGTALTARVKSDPSPGDFAWADVIVVLKRAAIKWREELQRAEKPIVWDALDFWGQPKENRCGAEEAAALLKGTLQQIKPTLTIGATQAMTEAIRAAGYAAEYLPHHGWSGLEPTPARPELRTVGFDGSDRYLGQWEHAIQAECDRRGWTFVINPLNLASVDLLVAFRDGEWDGWMCRQWKSGVKFVNAILAGRPILTQPCAAFTELDAPGTVLEYRKDLPAALDVWLSQDARQAVVDACQARVEDFALSAVAAQYRGWLERIGTEVPA